MLSVDGQDYYRCRLPLIIGVEYPIVYKEIIMGSPTLNGAIAEMRIWNTYLSADYIGYMMRSKFYFNNNQYSKNLIYYYPLNESQGDYLEERMSGLSSSKINR